LPKREVVDRQTLLFTATVPDGIRKVSRFSHLIWNVSLLQDRFCRTQTRS
jgi:superfamily II DNA/RNA helicase